MIDKKDYPIWHSTNPMGPFLRDTLAPGKFAVKGDGIRLLDADGNWYIDARSGLWNMSLGYSASEVKQAIARQLAELPFATLLAYDRPPQVTVEYARELREWFPGLPWMRFGNSGSQMTETAVLLSMFAHGTDGSVERTNIISLEGSYHGTGPGASALSGSLVGLIDDVPLSPSVHYLWADPGSWTTNFAQAIDDCGAERIAALIIEPLMGSSGVIPTDEDLHGVAKLCKASGIHFIADEVTTGFGRTGAMSRCQDIGIQPDMITLGKNMTTGYVPFGALMMSDRIYGAAFASEHATTFAAGTTTDGHPVAAAAGLAVLDYFRRHELLGHVVKVGAHLRERLEAVAAARRGQVAGVGLMQRFTLNQDNGIPWLPRQAEKLRLACEAEGLLVSRTTGGIWVMPPFIVDEADCDEIAARVSRALTRVS